VLRLCLWQLPVALRKVSQYGNRNPPEDIALAVLSRPGPEEALEKQRLLGVAEPFQRCPGFYAALLFEKGRKSTGTRSDTTMPSEPAMGVFPGPRTTKRAMQVARPRKDEASAPILVMR